MAWHGFLFFYEVRSPISRLWKSEPCTPCDVGFDWGSPELTQTLELSQRLISAVYTLGCIYYYSR